MYIYHALINALSAHMIHIDLNMMLLLFSGWRGGGGGGGGIL